MRIGLSSLIGEGFGSGPFTFGEVPSGGGFPPYGTVVNTLYSQLRSVANGGGYFVNPVDGSYVPTNLVTVDEVADGSGGTFIDWDTSRDAAPVPYGTVVVSFVASVDPVGYVTIWGNSYPTGERQGYQLQHNGSYSYLTVDQNVTVWTGNTITNDYTNGNGVAGYYEVNIFGTSLGNGKYSNYYITNLGWWGENSNQGSFFGYGTPTGIYDPSMGNQAYWDGNGGYYT